jgi:hypothetical protein
MRRRWLPPLAGALLLFGPAWLVLVLLPHGWHA